MTPDDPIKLVCQLIDLPLVDKVNREDIWREAAIALGVKPPDSTSRGKETFFDGKVFDPDNPSAYLASLASSRLAA